LSGALRNQSALEEKYETKISPEDVFRILGAPIFLKEQIRKQEVAE